MPETQTIAKDCGFEILRTEEHIRFLDRDVLGLELSTFFFGIASGFSALATVALWLTWPEDSVTMLAIFVLTGAAALFAFTALLSRYTYRAREATSSSEALVILVADLARGALVDPNGMVLARLAHVKVLIRYSLLGYAKKGRFSGARWSVHLEWPNGVMCVFKTMSQMEAKRVQRNLWQAGVGSA